VLRAALLARRPGVTLDGRVRLGRGVKVEVARGARLWLGDGCVLGAGSRVLVRGGTVRIGAGTRLDDDCRVVAHARVTIGERCVLGPQAAVMDAEPEIGEVEVPVRLQGLAAVPVVIGDGVVLGPGAVVLAGARVADGTVLGPRTVTGPALSRSGADRP
jgi:UDP-3-O-[3-hydroxymyristoyl] glucosamine N-acyltransferase